MAVSPSMAESLSANVVSLYAEAERTLTERIARNLAKGLDAPGWAEKKLSEVQYLTQQNARLIDQLGEKAAAQATLDITKAYNRGGSAAAAELAKTLGTTAIESAVPGLGAVEALAAETITGLKATGPRILRSTMDTYQTVIGEASQAVLQAELRSTTASGVGQVLTGAQTRRQAAQGALNQFAKKGIAGFVDKAGRGWSLQSYTEMAMRTGTGRAAVQGHTDKLQENGQDLVIISDAPRECSLCRPYEGKVFSISGTDPKYPPLQTAKDGGLWHANCRHASSLYQEGFTKPYGETADPEGYKAAQKQRRLERNIRESKRVKAAAMDDTAAKQAQAKVRAYQKKLREHVDANDLKRLPYREQVGRAI